LGAHPRERKRPVAESLAARGLLSKIDAALADLK